MSLSAKLEAWVHNVWARRGLVACALYPLSLIYQGLSHAQQKRTTAYRPPVPVVVVGNIYIGGTGKTPITITLVRALIQKGWRPGVVSRGFGRKHEGVTLVTAHSQASEVGDEPLLIAKEAQVPVAVGRDRAQATQHLLKAHPEVNLLISDDGLQHWALARDVEIAVIGARGLGNGWTLPAGPLREPPQRLDTVDALVLNTTSDVVVQSRTPRFAASSCFAHCTQLKTGQTASIDDLAQRLHQTNGQALAAAGIAAPGRFFAMVRAHDIDCHELELGDHFDFSHNPFEHRSESMILITSKDAVKCMQHPELKNDERIWVVGLEVRLDPYLLDFVDQAVRQAQAQLTASR